MRMDVRPILHTPGGRLPFRFEMDLSQLDFGGQRPISRPVEVEGCVRNRAGALELELTARTCLRAVCDRCGRRFDRDKSAAFRCALAETVHDRDSDEVLPLEPDGSIDAGGLARETFVLEMDSKTLCRQDCRGLCPRCGADLNVEGCRCEKEPDPRLAVLAGLLKGGETGEKRE